MFKQSWLVIVASVLVAILFWFRPGGVTGPRPEPQAPPTPKGFSHAAFTEVLQAVVGADGKVDYGKLVKAPAGLDRYLGQLRTTSPESAPHRFKTQDDRLAYYLNAYNAFVLAGLRDRCPIEKVSSAYLGSGFFWRIAFIMGEEEITLSALESEKVRDVQGSEPAVHLALIKGAAGYPPLPREAYEGAKVREQMAALGKRVAADERFVKITERGVEASELFQWYQADFGGDVLGWLKKAAPGRITGEPTLTYPPFDWSLNGSCGG